MENEMSTPWERKQARQRMYRRGPEITSIEELVREIEDQRYVFYHDRPNHPSWLRSMQLHVLIAGVQCGHFHFAFKNPTEE